MKEGTRTWIGRAILVVVSTAVALALAEWILARYEDRLIASQLERLGVNAPDDGVDRTIHGEWDERGESPLHVRSANDVLIYELRPDASVFVPTFGRTYATNADGFRDVPFAVAKPDDVCRIISIGDSVAFGWYQDPGQTYPKVLERVLNRNVAGGCRFEVYNMSVGGYDARQQVELVRTVAMRFDPDLIVMGLVHNDGQIGSDGGLWRHFTRGRFRTTDFLKLRWMRLRAAMSDEDLVERSYRDLVAFSADHNIPVIVVHFPSLTVDGDPTHDAHTTLHRERNEALARLELPVVDLDRPYRTAGPFELRSHPADPVHPNAQGHAIAAREIANFVASRVQCDGRGQVYVGR